MSSFRPVWTALPWMLLVCSFAWILTGGLDTDVALLKSEVEGLRYDMADVKLRVGQIERHMDNGSEAPDAKSSGRTKLSAEEIAKRRLKIHMDDPTEPAIKIIPRGFEFIQPDFLIGNVMMTARESRTTEQSRSQSAGSSESHNLSESSGNNGPNRNESTRSGTSNSTHDAVNQHHRVEHTTIIIAGEIMNRSKQNYKNGHFAITLYDKRGKVLGFGNFSVGYFRSATSLPFRATVNSVERKDVDRYKVVFINGDKEPAGPPRHKDAETIRKMQGG